MQASIENEKPRAGLPRAEPSLSLDSEPALEPASDVRTILRLHGPFLTKKRLSVVRLRSGLLCYAYRLYAYLLGPRSY